MEIFCCTFHENEEYLEKRYILPGQVARASPTRIIIGGRWMVANYEAQDSWKDSGWSGTTTEAGHVPTLGSEMYLDI